MSAHTAQSHSPPTTDEGASVAPSAGSGSGGGTSSDVSSNGSRENSRSVVADYDDTDGEGNRPSGPPSSAVVRASSLRPVQSTMILETASDATYYSPPRLPASPVGSPQVTRALSSKHLGKNGGVGSLVSNVGQPAGVATPRTPPGDVSVAAADDSPALGLDLEV